MEKNLQLRELERKNVEHDLKNGGTLCKIEEDPVNKLWTYDKHLWIWGNTYDLEQQVGKMELLGKHEEEPLVKPRVNP